MLGGALGVGIGFVLQKLAAGYVNGFVILAKPSMRIGDMVKVDSSESRITGITARHAAIRALNGREGIVPDEMMLTQWAEDSSPADPEVHRTSVVQVIHGTDQQAQMPRLAQVVAAAPQVLAEPAPFMLLSGPAADGLELTLVFWIDHPHNGAGNVRFDVNLAVWSAPNESELEIPFPQRGVRQVAAPAAPSMPPGSATAPPPAP